MDKFRSRNNSSVTTVPNSHGGRHSIDLRPAFTIGICLASVFILLLLVCKFVTTYYKNRGSLFSRRRRGSQSVRGNPSTGPPPPPYSVCADNPAYMPDHTHTGNKDPPPPSYDTFIKGHFPVLLDTHERTSHCRQSILGDDNDASILAHTVSQLETRSESHTVCDDVVTIEITNGNTSTTRPSSELPLTHMLPIRRSIYLPMPQNNENTVRNNGENNESNTVTNNGNNNISNNADNSENNAVTNNVENIVNITNNNGGSSTNNVLENNEPYDVDACSTNSYLDEMVSSNATSLTSGWDRTMDRTMKTRSLNSLESTLRSNDTCLQQSATDMTTVQ